MLQIGANTFISDYRLEVNELSDKLPDLNELCHSRTLQFIPSRQPGNVSTDIVYIPASLHHICQKLLAYRIWIEPTAFRPIQEHQPYDRLSLEYSRHAYSGRCSRGIQHRNIDIAPDEDVTILRHGLLEARVTCSHERLPPTPGSCINAYSTKNGAEIIRMIKPEDFASGREFQTKSPQHAEWG
jgi:hypothetical protein